MPMGSAKDKRMMALIATVISGLLLLFGVIPILNFGISTPIFAGFTFGTLIGLVLLYVSYLIWKNQI